MSEVAEMGKTLSIFVCGTLYLWIWAWAIDHQKKCNRNTRWEVLLAKLWIGVHIIAIIYWFIWSWCV